LDIMVDTTSNPETGADSSKARFNRALDEAKAGAVALGKEAQERADLYREKITSTRDELVGEAKVRSSQAREKATGMAVEGKTRASEAIAGLGKMVEENAALVDEKVGVKYGDYARSAARSMQDAAAKIDAKDVGELGEDAKQFVRNSPGLAVGLAAVAGFMLARLFKGSDD
jgi:ElaB/YqjD/DUF883 family membrane-anchored ribosome-binding protein